MRRYAFYLVVAVLAFGIGSFVAVKFYFKPVEQSLVIEKSQISENVQDKTAKDNFPSEEQFLRWKLDSFKPVIEKWLRGEKINQYVELKRTVEWALIAEREANVNLIDVNGDKIKELAIQTDCATVGNCEFWLFQRDSNSFKTILNTDMVQSYKLRKNKTHGYFDLETKSHGSAVSGGLNVYKFDSKEYILSECFEYSYTYFDKNGRSHELKKPILTRLHCC